MISATLSWGIVYLLNYPEVLLTAPNFRLFAFALLQVTRRVQNEIRSVTGGDRDLLLSDKAKTTYFNATINVCGCYLKNLLMNASNYYGKKSF